MLGGGEGSQGAELMALWQGKKCWSCAYNPISLGLPASTSLLYQSTPQPTICQVYARPSRPDPTSKVKEVQAGRSMVPDLSLEPVTSASPATLLEMQNRCLPSLTYRIRICFSDKIPRWFKWEVCQAWAVLGPSPPTGVSLELSNVPLNATSSPCLPWLCLFLPDIIWFHPLLGKFARLWLHSTVFILTVMHLSASRAFWRQGQSISLYPQDTH